jgi:hypothetical protein
MSTQLYHQQPAIAPNAEQDQPAANLAVAAGIAPLLQTLHKPMSSATVARTQQGRSWQRSNNTVNQRRSR